MKKLIFKYGLLGLGFAVFAGLIVLAVQRPSHDRMWQSFQSVMSDAVVSSESVTITNVRDWRHTSTTTYDTTYIPEVTITPEQVEQVWFTIQPFATIDAIGHTMLTFELTTGDAYTISIEARREVGEEYSSFKGLFRQYELLYSWGTARDFLGVRLLFLQDDLYHYPLQVTPAEAWAVLRYVAAATADIHDEAKFYNTATANCTNLLAKSINAHATSTEQLPYGLAWNLPGLSDQYLQKHGFIISSYEIAAIRSQPGLEKYVEELQAASRAPDATVFNEALRVAAYAVFNE